MDEEIIKARQNSAEWSKRIGLEKNDDSVGGLKKEESGQPLSALKGLTIKSKHPGFEIVEAGSGMYHFAVELQ